jgi:hypothetical protein
LIIQPDSTNPPTWAVELKEQLTDLKTQVSKLKASGLNGGTP